MDPYRDEILRKLNDTSINVLVRYKIAYGSLISSPEDFQLVHKEVFEWIANTVDKLEDDYFCVLHYLENCVKSSNLCSFKKGISPNPCLRVLEKSKSFLDNVDIQKLVRNCTKVMMMQACFKIYFENNIIALAKTVSLYYNALAVCGHDETDKCGICPELLVNIYFKVESSKLRNDFIVQFLDKMMPAIFTIPQDHCKCTTSVHMTKLLTSMFFSNNSADISCLGKFTKNITPLASAHPEMQALVQTFTKSVITFDENAMANFYSTIISLLIKHRRSCLFEAFIALASALGFTSTEEGMRSENRVHCQKALKILLAMMKQLESTKVSLTAEQSSEEFCHWLISLLKLLMSPAYGLSTHILKIIQSILHFAPTVFKHVIPQFVEYVMLVQMGDDIKTYYEITMITVMDIFQQLTRLNKLLHVMIETLSLIANRNPVLLPPCAKMLPTTVKFNFQRLVEKMSDSQAFKTITCLLYHLNLNIAEPLATSGEKINMGQISVLEFITTLLEGAFRNTKTLCSMGQQSKYYVLLANMASVLKIIGQTMLKQTYNVDFTKLFLKLSRVWGGCALLIKNYDDSNKFEETLINGNVWSLPTMTETDISHLFQFLTSSEWIYIEQRVCNFRSKESSDEFCTMLLQHLNFLKLTDVFIECKKSVIRFLSLANSEWLWENLCHYISFIDESSTLYLVKVLIDPKSLDSSYLEKIQILKALDGREARTILVAIGLELLHQIGKVLSCYGMNKTQHMLDTIVTKEFVLSAELFFGTCYDVDLTDENIDNEDDITMSKIKVQNYGDKMSQEFILDLNKLPTVDDIGEEDTTKIQKIVAMMCGLKISGLSPGSRKLILFGALSILCDFSQQNKKPPVELFKIITEILEKNIYVIGDLLLNKDFFQWFYNMYAGQSQRKVIFSLVSDYMVKQPDFSSNIRSLVTNIEIAPLLMSSYFKQQQSFKRKRDTEEKVQQARQNLEDCMRTVGKLLKLLIHEKGVQSDQLNAFSLLVKHSLFTKSDKRIRWCSKHLQAFYNIMYSNMLDSATTDLTNELVFIEIVFSNWSKFRSSLEANTHITLWRVLTPKAGLCMNCLHLILEAISVEEYVDVLEDLKKKTIKNNNLDTNLVFLDKVWEVVITAKINAEKIKKLLSYRDFIESELLKLHDRWIATDRNPASVRAVLCILTAIVKTPTIRIGQENLDIIFLPLSVLLQHNDFEALNGALNLLGKLLTKWPVETLKHLSSFLEIYTKIIRCVVKASSGETSQSKLANLYSCVNVVEKLAQALTVHKAELTPNVPYVIADIIQSGFEDQTINSVVKRSLLNTLNIFLSLCSETMVTNMTQDLSRASREIFKTIYKKYKKFHQYHGKV